MRLAATLERIELELELGRHTNAVADLEVLLAAHPLEERARGLLMLALYRSGRQARALEVYREGREALSETLGLEPGADLRELERSILRQDPGLGGQRRTLRALGPRRRLVAATSVGAVLTVAAAAWLWPREDQPNPIVVPRNALGVIDPDRNAVVGRVQVGIRPTGVAVRRGAVWVLNSDDRSVSRIDPVRRVVVRNIHFGPATTADELAVEAGSVWVPRARPGLQGNTTAYAAFLDRLDPHAPSGVQTIELVRAGTVGVTRGSAVSVAAGDGVVWAGIGSLLARVDAHRGAVVSTAEVENARDIAVGEGSVWIVNDAQWSTPGAVARFSPATRTFVATIPVGIRPSAIAVGEDAVWVTLEGQDVVARIDPDTNTVVALIRVGAAPTDVAVGAGAVWVANGRGKTVSRIEPRTNEVTATIPIGNRPDAIAVGAGAVWVTVY